MKNTLLCILVLLAAFLPACKKEKDSNPFTNGTVIGNEINYTIVVKNDSVILSYHALHENNQFVQDVNIDYFGDTLVKITTINIDTTHAGQIIKYYLNSHSYADSAIICSTQDSLLSNTHKEYYQYYQDGYLKCFSLQKDSCEGGPLQYLNGNYNGSDICEYYDYPAKLGIFSRVRRLSNDVMGKYDKNLLKRIGSESFYKSYYYQLDGNGYIVSCIIESNNGGNVGYQKFNYTYQFVQ